MYFILAQYQCQEGFLPPTIWDTFQIELHADPVAFANVIHYHIILSSDGRLRC